MVITDIIQHLESVMEKEGDIEVGLVDADTDWLYRMKPEQFEVDENSGKQVLFIGLGYQDETFD